MRYEKSAPGLPAHSMNAETSASITSTVMTAFFAAVIFLGIQSFRSPQRWGHRFCTSAIFS